MKINNISILLVAFSIFISSANSASDIVADRNHLSITIRHWQYFDSSQGAIITNEKKGISLGDFRFETTGYQYGGIGSINVNFMISMKPYKDVTVSRLKKIQDADFDSVSRSTCRTAEYDQSGEQILRVAEGDVICFSLDKNRDKIFGDAYLKIKIAGHIDSQQGNYADSMTFIYKRL